MHLRPFRLSFHVSRAVALAIASAALACLNSATATELALTFDAIEQVDLPTNLANPSLSPSLQAGIAEITDGEQRFGAGSLKILQDKTVVSQVLEADDWFEAFAGSTDQLTIALWLKVPMEGKGEIRILTRQTGGSAQNTVVFTLYGGKTPYFRMIATGDDGTAIDETVRVQGNLEPSRDQWTHLAMTFNRGEVVFYVDGHSVYQGMTATESIPALQNENRRAMRLNLLSMPAGSYVDDFYFSSDRALDAPQIESLFQSGLEAFLAEPQAP